MKKKNKTVLLKYTQPIFPIHNLVIIITNNISSLKYKFKCSHGYIDWKDEDIDLPGITWYGYTQDGDDELCVLIVLDPTQCQDEIDNTASHEALHAAYRMLDYLGISLNDDTNEVYAYVVGWVTQCIKETYLKWLKKH